MFEFHFEISGEDFFEYQKHHAYHTPKRKRSMLRQRIMYPLIYTGLGVYYTVNASRLTLLTVIMVTIALLWFLFFDRLVDWRIKRRLKRMEKEGKLYSPGFRTHRFEENSFIITAENAASESDYADFEQVETGEKAVYIYVGAKIALVLPNRVFADDGEKQRFVAFIRQKIGEAKNKTSAAASAGY